MRRLFLLLPILATAAWPKTAARRDVLDPVAAIQRKLFHEARQTQLAAASPDRGVDTILPDAGNIAVVDESEGVSVPAGFDLDQKTVEFKPSDTNASAYTFTVGASQFDAAAPNGATILSLDDDDAKEVGLQFSFPFYGVRYNSVWVHSDGNLAFGQPDSDHWDPNVEPAVRMLIGPARIGPFFLDLDPTQPGSAITYVSKTDRMIVTWKNVPPYSDHPGPAVPRETFQAVLFPDGRIQFSYSGVDATTSSEVPVGIAPGGDIRLTRYTLVHFSTGSSTTYTTAILEPFINEAVFQVTSVATKFYKSHEDSYDALIIFDATDHASDACGGPACACALPVKNWVHGIGLRVTSLGIQEFDASSFLGSAGRLQNLVYMGQLGRYPSDPAQNLPPGGICGRNNLLSILGQEAGHRYLAYPRFVDPANGQASTELLGRDSQHWSFYLNTDASVVEGNQILDHGAGTSPRFETKDIILRYSKLDQYLMGLVAPEEVPTTFFVRSPSIDFPRAHGPQSGVLFDGTRVDIAVPMIVAAEGKRAPDNTVSPKVFHFGFILVVPAGTTPAPTDTGKMDRIRTAWESFFASATDNRGQADTRLAKRVGLSLWPASGLIQGRTINASVTLSAPASSAVTISLATSGAGITAPASVVIPAGSRSATFPITGNSAGAAQLTARGPDASYETITAGLLVRPAAAGLVLEQLNTALLSGALILPVSLPVDGGLGASVNEQFIFRVRDENFLPYPGLKVNTSATGTGGTTPANPVTDANGRVRFNWTLDSNPGPNTLTVTLDGQPDVSAKAQATGTIQLPRRRDPRVPAESAP